MGFCNEKSFPSDALPFGTVLTLAATGSEMNSGSVITNWETNEKYGWGSEHVYPKFSILILSIHIQFRKIKRYMEWSI